MWCYCTEKGNYITWYNNPTGNMYCTKYNLSQCVPLVIVVSKTNNTCTAGNNKKHFCFVSYLDHTTEHTTEKSNYWSQGCQNLSAFNVSAVVWCILQKCLTADVLGAKKSDGALCLLLCVCPWPSPPPVSPHGQSVSGQSTGWLSVGVDMSAACPGLSTASTWCTSSSGILQCLYFWIGL